MTVPDTSAATPAHITEARAALRALADTAYFSTSDGVTRSRITHARDCIASALDDAAEGSLASLLADLPKQTAMHPLEAERLRDYADAVPDDQRYMNLNRAELDALLTDSETLAGLVAKYTPDTTTGSNGGTE